MPVPIREQPPITNHLAQEIASWTLSTGDPALWKRVAAEPPETRKLVVGAYLDQAKGTPSNPQVLEAIARLRPQGSLLGPWIHYLLQQLTHQDTASIADTLLTKVLLADLLPKRFDVLAIAWTAWVRRLLCTQAHDQALAVIMGRTTQPLFEAGAGAVVTQAWLELPAPHRTSASLTRLVNACFHANDSAGAATTLYQGLVHQQQESFAAALVNQWASLTVASPNAPNSITAVLPLVHAFRGSPHANLWAQCIGATAQDDLLLTLIDPAAIGTHDPIWVTAETARSTPQGWNNRDRLAAMADLLPSGATALEPSAMELLCAPRRWQLPDRALSKVAAHFARVPGCSPLWMWLSAAASLPDHYPNETLDATTTAFFSNPPRTGVQRATALQLARDLGGSPTWPDLGFARWVVRLLVAPDGDGTRFPFQLASAMLTGCTKRPDALAYLGFLTNQVAQLPTDHPAKYIYFNRLLTVIWPTGAPPNIGDYVQEKFMDQTTLAAYRRVVDPSDESSRIT